MKCLDFIDTPMKMKKYGPTELKKLKVGHYSLTINYVLDSPSLASTIDDVKQIFHDYDLTDRATSFFKSTNTGLAVIRAQVALFKYHDNT